MRRSSCVSWRRHRGLRLADAERSWRGLTGPGRTGRRRTRSGSLLQDFGREVAKMKDGAAHLAHKAEHGDRPGDGRRSSRLTVQEASEWRFGVVLSRRAA